MEKNCILCGRTFGSDRSISILCSESCKASASKIKKQRREIMGDLVLFRLSDDARSLRESRKRARELKELVQTDKFQRLNDAGYFD